MKKLKYVVYKCGSPALFGDTLKHSEMGSKSDIRSAGFCYIDKEEDDITVRCFGESDSLGIASMPEQDAKDIKYMLSLY